MLQVLTQQQSQFVSIERPKYCPFIRKLSENLLQNHKNWFIFTELGFLLNFRLLSVALIQVLCRQQGCAHVRPTQQQSKFVSKGQNTSPFIRKCKGDLFQNHRNWFISTELFVSHFNYIILLGKHRQPMNPFSESPDFVALYIENQTFQAVKAEGKCNICLVVLGSSKEFTFWVVNWTKLGFVYLFLERFFSSEHFVKTARDDFFACISVHPQLGTLATFSIVPRLLLKFWSAVKPNSVIHSFQMLKYARPSEQSVS